MTFGDLELNMTKHFEDRMKERGSDFNMDNLKSMIGKIKTKLTELPAKGEFLFFSRKYKQGVIGIWDAWKAKLNLITFLPKGKDYPKEGTDKIVVEDIGEYQIIFID